MVWIQSYSSTSAAGDSTADQWQALVEGRDVSSPWTGATDVRACLFKGERSPSTRTLLGTKLDVAFSQIVGDLKTDRPFGVILASTKGMLNDFVWLAETTDRDPLAPVLEDFLSTFALAPQRSLCVSNACSSSLAAMALAERWLQQGMEQVLILAADAVTPFVVKGFQALQLISSDGIRPFSADRNGFYLGEAAACLLLSKQHTPHALALRAIGLDSEGSAVTRPSVSGESVVRAALSIPALRTSPPDVVIAHGTGTRINDATEDLAFARMFQELPNRPLITGTKWCTGHTLAVSGALDTIAACEALRRGQLFSLFTTTNVDPDFHGRYATAGTRLPKDFSRIMISSLGFGGAHASALIERLQ